MLSNMKNSGSGPNSTVSAMLLDFRKSSARFGDGARIAVVALHGGGFQHVTDDVQSGLFGERVQFMEAGSGISTMSDSLMPFQPPMEEPSNILPSSKKSSSTWWEGMDTCCSLPWCR